MLTTELISLNLELKIMNKLRKIFQIFLKNLVLKGDERMMKNLSNDQIEFYMIQIGCPCGASDKESAYKCKRGKRCEFDPWVGKIPWRRKLQPIPVYLPGKSHGQRSLLSYILWGWKKSDMTSIAQANDIN